MMEWLRKFFDTGVGKMVAATVMVVACAAFYVEARNTFSPPDLAAAREHVFVDAQTGQGFKYELVRGDSIPIVSPYTGQKTGYPAELCYWNADGSIRSDPTPVLLNSWIGKPGPTFCPVCGRLVVPRNPYPQPGAKPPLTREEYEQMYPNLMR
jgi:hypothetical protein